MSGEKRRTRIGEIGEDVTAYPGHDHANRMKTLIALLMLLNETSYFTTDSLTKMNEKVMHRVT